MKTYITYFLIFSALSATPAFSQESNAVDWGSVSHNLQMSISIKGGNSDVQLGQKIVLTAKYKNLSNKTFTMYEYNGAILDPSYDFKVTSPSGHDISPDMKNISPSDSGAVKPIAPGQIYEVNLDLSLVCKFETTGTYKIVATKQVQEESGTQFKLVSNPLYINVVQRHPKGN
jgi:hypothetical protein